MKDAVKALIKNEQGEVLVLFRSHTHPYLAHDIDLPGGEVDIDETVEAALLREVFEETGLTIQKSSVNLLSSLPTTWGQQHFLYEATADPSEEVVISWEHKSYIWMKPEDFAVHEAIDGFMHQVQAWLNNNLTVEDNSTDKSLQNHPAHAAF